MVSWNAGTDSGIAGYMLHYGPTNGSFASHVDVGTNTSAVVPGLPEGQTNYFAVAAYNVVGLQGPASPALTYIVPGFLKVNSASGNGLTFPVSPGHWYEVQAATNLNSWTTIWQTSAATSNAWVAYQDPQAGSFSKRYYRLILH